MPSFSETWLTYSSACDREAVVLHGDEHAAGARVAHGVVRAAVAERKLERVEPEREAEQLVAEADAEERHAPEQVAHGLDRAVRAPPGRPGRCRRAPRSAGARGSRRRPSRPGRRRPRRPSRRAAAGSSACSRGRRGRRAGPAPTKYGSSRPRVPVERPAVDRRLGERAGVQLRNRRVADRAAQDAVLADAPHERARVDVVDRDDALLAQPRRPLGPRRAHDDRLRLHAVRLGARRVDAVVADERIGEAENLGDVARVGRRLLVARARGREARLARRHARGRRRRVPGKTVPSSRTSAAERLMRLASYAIYA